MKRSIPILIAVLLFGMAAAHAQRREEPATKQDEIIIIEDLEDAINDATEALREAHADYDETIKVFRDSSLRQLRIEVKAMSNERAQMRKELQELRKDLRNQIRELKKLESSRSVDADSLRRELARATEALDAAERSLDKAFSPFAAQTHRLRGNNYSLDSSFAFPPPAAMGKSPAMVLEMNDSLLNAEMDALRMSFRMDSSGGYGMLFSGNNAAEGGNNSFQLRYFNDSSAEGRSHVLMIRTFEWKDEQNAEAFNEDSPLLIKGNTLYVGDDSVTLQDTRNAQMTIRVDKNESSSGRSQVVIVTLSRGAREPFPSIPDPASSTSSLPFTRLAGYQLAENQPNPFSASTTIGFTIPRQEHVSLKVFDGSGRVVKTLKDEVMEAGSHTVRCNAGDLPSGLYLYRLEAGSFSETRTMTVAK